MPTLSSIDHIVLTVTSIYQTAAFYERVLSMTPERFKATDGTDRTALKFGHQKINLHQVGLEFDPKAATPRVGAADICFLTQTPIADWIAHLDAEHVEVEQGPIARTGATGPILSIYIRDPDGNLIEISTPA